LIDAATDDIDNDGDQGNDTKYTARTELLFVNLDASAGGRRAGLEDVGAAVWRGDERDGVERG
jgi:hypothetical protein